MKQIGMLANLMEGYFNDHHIEDVTAMQEFFADMTEKFKTIQNVSEFQLEYVSSTKKLAIY